MTNSQTTRAREAADKAAARAVKAVTGLGLQNARRVALDGRTDLVPDGDRPATDVVPCDPLTGPLTWAEAVHGLGDDEADLNMPAHVYAVQILLHVVHGYKVDTVSPAVAGFTSPDGIRGRFTSVDWSTIHISSPVDSRQATGLGRECPSATRAASAIVATVGHITRATNDTPDRVPTRPHVDGGLRDAIARHLDGDTELADTPNSRSALRRAVARALAAEGVVLSPSEWARTVRDLVTSLGDQPTPNPSADAIATHATDDGYEVYADGNTVVATAANGEVGIFALDDHTARIYAHEHDTDPITKFVWTPIGYGDPNRGYALAIEDWADSAVPPATVNVGDHVWIAEVDHASGDTSRWVATTEAAAWAHIAAYVRDEWDHERSKLANPDRLPATPPDDDQQAITTYFEVIDWEGGQVSSAPLG